MATIKQPVVKPTMSKVRHYSYKNFPSLAARESFSEWISSGPPTEAQLELKITNSSISIGLVSGAKQIQVFYNVDYMSGYDARGGTTKNSSGFKNVALKDSMSIIIENYSLKVFNLDLCIINQIPFIEVPSTDMPTDLKHSLANNKALNDVTIIAECDRTEIKASKFMLCARSEYFDTMFRTNMKEKETNSIESSFEPEICREIVSYIHTDETPNIKKPGIAEKLWCAAHMYELPGLQVRCTNTLSDLLTAKNAAHLLAFTSSDKYCEHLTKLREYVLAFITADNHTCKWVMDSDGWSEEIAGNLDIVHEVLEQLAGGYPPQRKKKRSI